MMLNKIAFLLFIAVILAGCENKTDSNTTNANAVNSARAVPSPAATLSEAEKEKVQAKSKAEKKQAINEFLTKQYPGWKFIAQSDSYNECNELSDTPCNLLIEKSGQQKVLAVLFRRFEFESGEEKLVVFEARPIDLSKARLEQIKQNVKDNLTYDDIDSALRAEIVGNQEYYAGYEK